MISDAAPPVVIDSPASAPEPSPRTQSPRPRRAAETGDYGPEGPRATAYAGLVRRVRGRSLLNDVTSLALCGLVAGLVVAAAALPAAAVAGLGAKSASDSFQNLPAELQIKQQPLNSQILDAKGNLITEIFDENRKYAPLRNIPPVMRDAIIAAEDTRFYSHQGVDPKGIIRALVANQQAGSIEQGASTLTQQYVKRVLTEQANTPEEVEAATGRDYGRKLREIRYAVALEKKLSKEEILERYLNIAYFGQNAYGVAAAAQTYFSKGLATLTLNEATTLAGLVQAPSSYDPLGGPEKREEALNRRNYVLQRMVDLKYATQDQADKAKAEPIPVKPRTVSNNCATIPQQRSTYGFFCDWLVEWWKNNPAFGKTRTERMNKLTSGGYRITTSIDPDMQAAAVKGVNDQLSKNQQFALGVVLVEPGTGRIKAMAVNRNYSLDSSHNEKLPDGRTTSYPNTVNPLLGGNSNSPGYQAGSTFKMFTMVAALEQGMPLNTKYYAPQRYKSHFRDTSKSEANCGGYYCPKNASPGMTGTHTMWSGFGESVNTYFVQLEEDVGVRNAVETSKKLGVTYDAEVTDFDGKRVNQGDFFAKHEFPSFTLGVASVTPLDMATAYATVAARGKRCDPTPIQSAVDQTGKAVPWATPACKQVIPPEVADAANDAARCPVGNRAMSACSKKNGATARRASNAFVHRPLAGKTGSTDLTRSAFFIGYTPNLAGAAFVADPDRPNVSAAAHERDALTAWGETMKVAVEKVPEKDFVKPGSKLTKGIGVTVPDVSGDNPQDAKRRLEQAGFRVRIDEDRVNSRQDEGTVAYTSPEGGDTANKNGRVTIFVSNGVAPRPKPSKTRPASRPTLPIFPPPDDGGGGNEGPGGPGGGDDPFIPPPPGEPPFERSG
jgi:membrane peptidoglycan carboxypeptidase